MFCHSSANRDKSAAGGAGKSDVSECGIGLVGFAIHDPSSLPSIEEGVQNVASRIFMDSLLWVGIQWLADDLLFDFETCPNYQKLP